MPSAAPHDGFGSIAEAWVAGWSIRKKKHCATGVSALLPLNLSRTPANVGGCSLSQQPETTKQQLNRIRIMMDAHQAILDAEPKTNKNLQNSKPTVPFQVRNQAPPARSHTSAKEQSEKHLSVPADAYIEPLVCFCASRRNASKG